MSAPDIQVKNDEFGNDAVIWVCQRNGDYFPHPECPFPVHMDVEPAPAALDQEETE